MRFEDVSVPEVYTESEDFRFFLKWIWSCLAKAKYDTEHLSDIYDPLKCKRELLWMLADTVGYKYDDRLPAAFNRLVLLYFMQMMRLKGSKSGVTFAAEINLAQFNIIANGAGYEDDDGNWVEGKDVLYDRLDDTSVPVNSVYVSPVTDKGYIDVVYFSTELPVDACIEYVRPLGMYLFQHSGVEYSARTQISIDARLTNSEEMFESIGPAHVADYTRRDYASLQPVDEQKRPLGGSTPAVDPSEYGRDPVYYRNPVSEGGPDPRINPGYRALYSLQLCNNEHITKALIDPIFSLGLGPKSDGDTVPDEPYYITEGDVTVVNPKSYLKNPYNDEPIWNLRYDRDYDQGWQSDVAVQDEGGDPGTPLAPKPAVNPIMMEIGDAIQMDDLTFTESEGGKLGRRRVDAEEDDE